MDRRMHSWLIVGILFATAAYALSETFTLETYYPSPRGVYAELRVGGGGPWPTGSGRDAPGYLEVIHYDPSKQNPAFRVDTDNPATRPVVVDYLGNVGIGTASPIGKLDLGSAGQMFIGASSNPGWTVPAVQLGQNAIFSRSTLIDITSNAYFDGTTDRYITTNNYPAAGIDLNGDQILFRVAGTGTAGNAITWTNAMSVGLGNNSGTGNVGIGTPSPGAKLEVLKPGSDGDVLQKWAYADSPSNVYDLKLKELVSTNLVKWAFDQTNNDTAYSNVLVLDRGKVGIGTTTPGYDLDVAGKFHVSNAAANNALIVVPSYNNILSYVGINTGQPSAYLHITGPGNTAEFLRLDETNSTYAYGLSSNNKIFSIDDLTAGGASRLAIKSNGDVAIAGNLSVVGAITGSPCCSDVRLKTNIQPLSGVLEKLQGLQAIRFDWNELYQAMGRPNAKDRQIGLIAQEVEPVFPELVTTGTEPEHYKAIDYPRLTAVLVEAIKEQEGEIKTLKARLEALEKR